MNKQKPAGSNKQSATESGSKQSAQGDKPKAGKDAASHTKAGSKEGAGGGKKQARNH
jgi:hypothetical protein